MKLSLFKKIGSAFVAAAMLASSVVMPASAATSEYRPITFSTINDDVSRDYIVSNSGQINGSGYLFCDGNNTAVFRFNIDPQATVASLVLTVAQNYVLEISADGVNWTDQRVDESLAGIGECNEGNKKEIVYDISSYCPGGVVYFRLGDQTTGNGWGGVLFNVLLTYTKYVPEVIEPFTDKVDFEFVPGSKMEQRFIPEGKGGGTISGRMRFMDHTNTVTYRLPFDNTRTAYLNMVLAANYTVRISVNDRKYVLIAAAEGGAGVDEFGTSNKGLISININNALAENNLTPESDFIYIKIGDQTTGSGWGGQLFYLGLHYGNDNGMYNAMNLKGVKNTAVRFKQPQKVVENKIVYTRTQLDQAPADGVVEDDWSDTAVQDITTNDLMGDIAFEDPLLTDTESTAEVVSETTLDWDGITSEVVSDAPVAAQDTPAENTSSNSGVVWYIVIGVVAVVLLGGAVTQFILMEKKRKAKSADSAE